MQTACAFCGQPVSVKSKTTLQKITGWEKKRRQGGANQIIMRKVLPEYAHSDCAEAVKLGVIPGQESLFN